jgi:AhpD family alkylhydroperoxidase
MSSTTRPRFQEHTIESAPERIRPTLWNLQAKFGRIDPAAARIANSPELLDAFLTANAFFERTSLAPLQREALVMTVASRNGCRVCIEMHSAALRGLGADQNLISRLRAGEVAADAGLAALQGFVRAVMETAGAVTDEQLTAFIDAGFDRTQALEVVLGIGTYTLSTFANRMTQAEPAS